MISTLDRIRLTQSAAEGAFARGERAIGLAAHLESERLLEEASDTTDPVQWLALYVYQDRIVAKYLLPSDSDSSSMVVQGVAS
jgi:hypothetical protein